MTREEAIKRIKDHMEVHKLNEPRAIKITEALDMAIKALEDIDEIKSIIECPLDIQEDVFRYKAICNVFERDEKR